MSHALQGSITGSVVLLDASGAQVGATLLRSKFTVLRVEQADMVPPAAPRPPAMDSAELECLVARVRSVVARVHQVTSVQTALLNARLVLLVASDPVAAPTRNVLAHASQDDGDLQHRAARSALACANLGALVGMAAHHRLAHNNALPVVTAYVGALARLVLKASTKSVLDRLHASIVRVESIRLRMVIRVQQVVYEVMVLNNRTCCTCSSRSKMILL